MVKMFPPAGGVPLLASCVNNDTVQIGHFIYNAAAPYFDALVTAFSTGTYDGRQQFSSSNHNYRLMRISMFWYPDSK